MKKLLVLMLVLGMASAANAALLISVDGQTDLADTEVTLMPSDTVVIDIWGDGATGTGDFLLGLDVGGPGALNIDDAVILYAGSYTYIGWLDYAYVAGLVGLQNPMVMISMTDVPPVGTPKAPLEGTLVDGIIFHCDGLGDVTLSLYDLNLALLDTQVIHQIPEPMTIALLGLGGLFLRRRK